MGSSFAQSALSLRYMGLTIHPFGDSESRLEPYKLDKNAYFVPNFGFLAAYEKYVWEDIISIKILQGAFLDCSAGRAGVTHIGFRGVLVDRGKHHLTFGMGPTMYYREDWNRFASYNDGGVFHRLTTNHFGSIQYKFFWYGCEFEYDYRLTKKLDMNFGFTPGAPLALLFSAGVKYWLNKDFKKTEKFIVPKKKK
jgi:hypothetical protein